MALGGPGDDGSHRRWDDRYADQKRWRASGRVEAEDSEEDTSPFVVERDDDRWLWTDMDGTLRAVGDAVRDLVATEGGLRREPAPRGFLGHDGVELLRRLGPVTPEVLASFDVVESRETEHAGRPAVDHLFRHGEYAGTVGVDLETGIWTYLHTAGLTIAVERLTVGEATTDRARQLLDAVPDVDLSHREPVSPSLAAALRTVRESSGCQVEVVDQDPETHEFRFVLVNDERRVVGQVRRRHALWDQSPALFGGSQAWLGGEEYEVHVDTSFDDRQAASLILRDLLRVVPDA